MESSNLWDGLGEMPSEAFPASDSATLLHAPFRDGFRTVVDPLIVLWGIS